MITEFAYWKAIFASRRKPEVKIIPYVPQSRQIPPRCLEVESAWKGIESILSDIMHRFHLGHARCLEFGVEFGYSTVAFSAYFDSVKGIDIFVGDRHTSNKEDIYETTKARLAPYSNIEIIRCDYKSWITKDTSTYDLVHVDIVHTYADTFACGLWSAQHSACVLFHDTISFPAVRQAVIDIARITGKTFYNFEESFGLGILVDESYDSDARQPTSAH